MGKQLVLAEKPSVAKDYAAALNCNNRHDGYYEGNEYVISWAVGHLFSLKEPEDYDEKYKSWNLEDLPIIPEKFGIKLIPITAKQFKIIKELIHRNDITGIVNGGDAGREGEIIQRWILMAAGNKKPVKRLWVSTLTMDEIKKGFKNLKPAEKYDNLYYAASARSEVDWLYGMNYSRAYTKKRGKNVLLTIGRCQTPTLNLIVERDNEILNFVPEPYYEIKTQFQDYSGRYFKENSFRISAQEDAEEIKKAIENKTGVIKKIEKEEKSTAHPQLHNLTSLQRAMNSKYGMSAKKTLNTAQSLYETHKILSYPRASSRYIDQSMVSELPLHIKSISFEPFKAAAEKLDVNNLKVTKRFVDGTKISDHHAIVPAKNEKTAEIYETLSKDEKNLFNEVVQTFLSCFYPDYKYESTTIITDVEGYEFKTTGIKEISLGWKEIYKEAEESQEELDEQEKLPELQEGQKEKVVDVNIENKKTKAPAKFTEASLLKQLEDYGIGTEATRADLIETLLDREYIKRDKKHLISTQLGQDLISIIETEALKSVELTAQLESELEDISSGKINKAQLISKTIDELKNNIQSIINSDGEMIEKKKEIIGTCPICKDGQIVEGKTGWGCNKFKENDCKFFLKKEIQEQNISLKQLKKLIEKGSTDVIQGFKKKEGEGTFDAALIIKDGRIQFKPVTMEDLYLCPVCKKGRIKGGEKNFYCTEYKNSCKFTIPYIIAKKKITPGQIRKLLENGKTDIIKGFSGEYGEFDAALVISDGKIKFQKQK